MPIPSLESLLAVTPLDATTFEGASIDGPFGRVFGGQLLGQAVISAARTVSGDRVTASISASFLRPGDCTQPVTYRVDKLRDGGSFSSRRVEAEQNHSVIFVMDASFQARETRPDIATRTLGDGHLAEIPESNSYDNYAMSSGGRRAWSHRGHFDIRPAPCDVPPPESNMHAQAVWFRLLEAIPTGLQRHNAALAFASDFTLLQLIAQSIGLSPKDPGLGAATLNHSVWWHEEADVNDWLLYVQEVPTTPGFRGLAFARVYNRAGILVASVAQEGIARPSKTSGVYPVSDALGYAIPEPAPPL